LSLRNAASGWNTAGEPDIAADRRALADGNPAEDGCAGLDDHIIADDRTPRSSPEQGAMASDVARGVGLVDHAAKPSFASPADYVMKDQLLIQAKTVLFTLLYSGIGSAVLYKLADLAIGLRASKQAEIEDLDISDHGERAYNV
jgi:Ammonium Transporter Family